MIQALPNLPQNSDVSFLLLALLYHLNFVKHVFILVTTKDQKEEKKKPLIRCNIDQNGPFKSFIESNLITVVI